MRRLALVGSRAQFTHGVLAAFVERRMLPVALLLHGVRGAGALPVETPHPVDRLARANGIAVSTVRDGREALEACRQSGAEVALVACFPVRLPVEEGRLPSAGLFNLHPSPLPAYRGPAPLFWQFRAGVTRTAVSLHGVQAGFDTGPVLAREWLDLPATATFGAVNWRLALLGAGLAVSQLVQSTRIPEGETQANDAASHFGFPDRAAFEISVDWPAERLYRFVVGTGEWCVDYTLRCEAGVFRVRRALGFDPVATQPDTVVATGDGVLSIRCNRGTVVVAGERVA